jgi:hypothetical protein
VENENLVGLFYIKHIRLAAIQDDLSRVIATAADAKLMSGS